jgi:hypothetical protein
MPWLDTASLRGLLGQEEYLLNWVKSETQCRGSNIYLMGMLGACGTDNALTMLLAYALSKSEDNRVRQAAVVSAGRCEHVSVEDLIPLVSVQEGVIARLSVETMIGQATAEQANQIISLCEGRGADIYAASLRLLETAIPGEGYSKMREMEGSSQEHYDKVQYIRAMGSYAAQESRLQDFLNGITQSATPMLKTAFADALVEYLHSDKRKSTDEENLKLSRLD